MADRRYTINAFTVNLQSSGFHPEAAEALLELLSTEDVKATFFTESAVSGHIAAFTRQLHAHGHETGLLITPSSETPHRNRLSDSLDHDRKTLEDLIGHPIAGCRILHPFMATSQSSETYEILAESGFAYSSSLYPPRNFRLGIQNSKRRAWIARTDEGDVWELPVTAWRPLGLGIFSVRSAHPDRYPVWTIARNIDGMNRHGEPAILSLRHLPQFRQDTRNRTFQRLRHIFRGYRFSSTFDAFASRLTTEFEEIPRNQLRRTSIIRCDARTAMPFL